MKKDLTAGSLVMCKAHGSDLEGWRVQHYWQKGKTHTNTGSAEVLSSWRYIVPLKYFNPTCTDWRPEEKYNWANFEEEEK